MNPQPITVNDQVSKKDGMIANSFLQWLQWLVGLVMRAPVRMTPDVNLTAQAASIAATDLAPVQYSGVYRISHFLHITRAATTSSSVQLVVSFVSDGTTLTNTSTAVTGNTTTTFQTGSILVYIDGGTTPSFTVTYASVGATSAQYRLTLLLELCNA